MITPITTTDPSDPFELLYIRIDPNIWGTAHTWVNMTGKPVLCEYNNDLFVLSKTRLWTLRTFSAAVASRWNVYATPTMMEELYIHSMKHNLVPEYFTKLDSHMRIGSWWNQIKRELLYNCIEWNPTNPEILRFIDPINVKFKL